MSTFDIRPDAPGLLRVESINIVLKFDRTGPNTGRISWNIPTPAPGCTAATQAYCGMLVTIDTTPVSGTKVPQRGEVYSSDATADGNLFAGDRLGTSFVIGAFYEDRTTTFFDVEGLKPNTPYYVSGFPVDCQYRYFIEGVHAYSLDFTNRGTDGTNGTQVVVMNADSQTMGVDPNVYTGLDASLTYEFTMQLGLDPKPQRPIDSVECRLASPRHNIEIRGEEAQTYAQLVEAMNREFALLSNTTQGANAPNSGSYYFSVSQQKLFQWNGSEHIEIPVLIEDTQPDVVTTGTQWLNTTTDTLSIWSGTAWVVQTVLSSPYDPTVAQGDVTYWFDTDTNIAYLWNGVTWCEVVTYNQPGDPSVGVNPAAGSYWYDEANSILYRWNNVAEMWTRTDAVQSNDDPNALTNATYWFNDVTSVLSRYAFPDPGWNVQSNVTISEIAPATPAPGKLWYNPTTMVLFRRNVGNTGWDQQDLIVFHQDPTTRAICDLWWEIDTDTINVWNAETSLWVAAPFFYIQSRDPSLPPELTDGTIWHDTTNDVYYQWDGNCFKPAVVIAWPTDPNLGTVGAVWHNTTTGLWYNYVSVGTWTLFDPIDSPTDPNALTVGTFWYKPSPAALKNWNGLSWVTVAYSTSPYTPAIGTLWFDTTTNTLKEWSGAAWVASLPAATVEFDCNSNLMFTDTNVGSTSFVNITDVSLFKALELIHVIHNPKPGTDGASDEPMYTELGIGTNGSDAARNALLTDIRYELGYPVVDVELTKEQMDYAIDRALSELRSHSSVAYKRGFVFMGIPSNQQRFFLTSKRDSHNRIVDILGVYRLTSSFLSSAHGAGVYGQIVLQHLYNMGNFDLLSFHMMADYTKLLETLFAGKVTYTWNEQTRELFLHNRFSQREVMVCLEITEERTEQDIMTDRYTKSWIRRYASGVCRLILAESRGKFSTLPGASGSVTLNASDLRTAAKELMDECMAEIENFVADRPEEYGMGTTFLFG